MYKSIYELINFYLDFLLMVYKFAKCLIVNMLQLVESSCKKTVSLLSFLSHKIDKCHLSKYKKALDLYMYSRVTDRGVLRNFTSARFFNFAILFSH